FFFQAEDGIRDFHVTGVQTCALPISRGSPRGRRSSTPCSSSIDVPGASLLEARPSARQRSLLPSPESFSTRKISTLPPVPALNRSEERRVGKESRSQRTRRE